MFWCCYRWYLSFNSDLVFFGMHRCTYKETVGLLMFSYFVWSTIILSDTALSSEQQSGSCLHYIFVVQRYISLARAKVSFLTFVCFRKDINWFSLNLHILVFRRLVGLEIWFMVQKLVTRIHYCDQISCLWVWGAFMG